MSTERIHLRGDLDLGTVDAFTAQVAATSAPVVEVDASELAFVDSTGLRGLLQAKEHLVGQGRQLRIVARSAALDRLLDISRAGALFDD